MDEPEFEAGVGGPGPEDFANGAAALAAGLTREARVLAQAAAGLRGAVAIMPGDPAGGAMSDVRRQRLALQAAGDAALKAALLLEAAELLGAGGDLAERLSALVKRAGMPATLLVAPLRAAALSLKTDDGAARIAAAHLAQVLAERLGHGQG